MSIRLAAFFFILILFTTSCYKEHLYVQQEWVDRNSLASTKVNTPDPRQANPPEGERLLVAWRFPKYLIYQEIDLILTVRFWDNSEEIIHHPISKTHGNASFNFFGEKILTYRIQAVNAQGEVIQNWEHHFWTELIDIDRKRSSVSSQPKQGSVIETP
jgi:hypothetical protein